MEADRKCVTGLTRTSINGGCNCGGGDRNVEKLAYLWYTLGTELANQLYVLMDGIWVKEIGRKGLKTTGVRIAKQFEDAAIDH